jgi:hypothetical protein
VGSGFIFVQRFPGSYVPVVSDFLHGVLVDTEEARVYGANLFRDDGVEGDQGVYSADGL